ncbi:hypothetical protein HMPREF9413_4844 [Paenibacillus sp. HGF7]|nr:hypothetical protein HMPREF9413_4844 [Paenibacillus sp. HGF7]
MLIEFSFNKPVTVRYARLRGFPVPFLSFPSSIVKTFPAPRQPRTPSGAFFRVRVNGKNPPGRGGSFIMGG